MTRALRSWFVAWGLSLANLAVLVYELNLLYQADLSMEMQCLTPP